MERPLAARRAPTPWYVVALALAANGAVVAPPPARAHLGSQKLLELTPTDAGATLRVDVERVDASIALGLGVHGLDPSELSRHGSLIRAWLARDVRVSRGERPCDATASEPRAVTRDGREMLSVTLDYACAAAGSLRVADASVFDDDPDHEVLVTVVSGDARAVHVLRDGARELVLGGEAPSTVTTAVTFLGEGALHLFTGYDHMLFLLSLLFAAGMLARRDGSRAALRDVAWLVTAFTLGHSLTLVAAALEWVALPSGPVEIAIAASIVLVAAMNVARPEAHTARPWLAFGFGLVHGFGFSSVLAEVGLPPAGRVVALLSFNVGIEAAQLAFVAVCFAPLAWLARDEARYRAWVMRAGSVAIAGLAAFWVVERAIGL